MYKNLYKKLPFGYSVSKLYKDPMEYLHLLMNYFMWEYISTFFQNEISYPEDHSNHSQ